MLRGKRLLLVEDEYMIAVDLADALEAAGAEVVGPADTVESALAVLRCEDRAIDAAVLDINLNGMAVFPVAEALKVRGIPFVFATAYDEMVVPAAYGDVPLVEKPVSNDELLRLLEGRTMRQ